MFTKEKLEKWIDTLNKEIVDKEDWLNYAKERINEIEYRKKCIEDLKTTLEQLHKSITSDGSI
jgi:chromosome segregation ATPase